MIRDARYWRRWLRQAKVRAIFPVTTGEIASLDRQDGDRLRGVRPVCLAPDDEPTDAEVDSAKQDRPNGQSILAAFHSQHRHS